MNANRIRRAALLAALLFSLPAASAVAQESTPPDGGAGSSGSSGIAAGGLEQSGQRILIEGREVETLRAGVAATVELTFVNQSDSAFTGVTAVPYPSDQATVTPREISLGDVAPGATVAARFNVTIDKECTEFFGLAGELRSGTTPAGYFKAGFPVACPGARLTINEVRIAGGDGDSAPEPGELVTVLVVLHNGGADPATDVRGTMTVANREVEVVTATAAWPDIPAGESAAALAPFTMRISPDAEVQEGCSGIEPGIVVDPAEPASDQPGSTEPGAAGDTPVSSDGNSSSADAPPPETPVESKPSEGGTDPGLIDPVAPDGAEPAPQPPPQPDQGVTFNAIFEIAASGQQFGLEFSNGVVCAYADGRGDGEGARDLPARADQSAADALKSGASRGDGGPAMPLLAAFAAVAAALGVRRALLSRSLR